MTKLKLNDLIGGRMVKLVKLKRQMIDAEMKQLGLTRTQWQLLVWLNILEIPCTQQELLKHFEVDAAHLARLLECLESSKYIIRTPVPGNRRSLLINVTPAGKKLMANVEQVVLHQNEVALAGFTPAEIKKFHTLLDKLEKNLMS